MLDFFDGFFVFDNILFVLGVVRNLVVIEVGDVYVDFEC